MYMTDYSLISGGKKPLVHFSTLTNSHREALEQPILKVSVRLKRVKEGLDRTKNSAEFSEQVVKNHHVELLLYT